MSKCISFHRAYNTDGSGRLYQLRQERNCSMEEIADFLSINRSTYSKYEKYGGFSDREIKLLSEFYGVSADYLLGGSDYKKLDNAEIGDKTGLTDEAINILIDWQDGPESFDDSRKYAEILSELISHPDFVGIIKRILQLKADKINSRMEVYVGDNESPVLLNFEKELNEKIDSTVYNISLILSNITKGIIEDQPD